MTIKQVNFTVADFTPTRNGAIWKKSPSKRIVFVVDERSYGCNMYDLYVEFKNKKQVESLFEKSFSLISSWDIIELCSFMVDTSYCTQGNKISGVYDFATKELTLEQYHAQMEQVCPGING